ncbi:MAG: sulfatase-like hydrolase/transferase, partial [Planctomycetes bacterium]|nr:sulfatase-like hydrolase/transferase [Planctomycetota bacterium]
MNRNQITGLNRGNKWFGFWRDALKSGTVPALIGLSLLFWFACGEEEQAPDHPAKKPNIVFVVVDTMATTHLSLYGYDRPTSPNMERLAAEGAVFRNAISASPWTLPSHASLFTGLYPTEHWATGEHSKLDPEHMTLAKALLQNGYHTIGFSNNGWVGPNSGLHRGFEYFTYLAAWNRTEPEYEKTVSLLQPNGEYSEKKETFERKPDQVDAGSKLTNNMIAEIFKRKRNDDKPVFLFVNYLEPHLPYWPPDEFARRFLSEKHDLETSLAIRADTHAHETKMKVHTDE